MEFDHVGGHCAAEACNQRDFLPFTCSTCKETFCLAHRSALAHNCSGADSRDVTSIDCPICSKSIRMTKADNPDLVVSGRSSPCCFPCIFLQIFLLGCVILNSGRHTSPTIAHSPQVNPPLLVSATRQIGRASCRERVL